MIITLHKTHLQTDQRPQYKTSYIETDSRELIGTRKLSEQTNINTMLISSFLVLKSTINKWDP